MRFACALCFGASAFVARLGRAKTGGRVRARTLSAVTTTIVIVVRTGFPTTFILSFSFVIADRGRIIAHWFGVGRCVQVVQLKMWVPLKTTVGIELDGFGKSQIAFELFICARRMNGFIGAFSVTKSRNQSILCSSVGGFAGLLWAIWPQILSNLST